MHKLFLDYEKILKIRNDIDSLLQSDNGLGAESVKDFTNLKEKRKKIDSNYKLDKVERRILTYIFDNPGNNKENIVKLVKENIKSSRVPILKKIKRLENSNYIIAKRSGQNGNSYELYYNNENVLANLIKKLEDFKKSYFLLLDFIKESLVNLSKKCEKQMMTIRKDNNTNGNDTSCAQFILLSQNIISPFRNLILILLYSNFIPFNIREYNESVVLEKFTIINEFIKDVIIKLLDVFPKRSKRQINIDEISVIHGLEYEMLPSSIEENINFFSRYNLKERAEDLWESLWKIVYPFLRLFNFYVHIEGQMKRNSVDSVKKLLDIKQQYAHIEKDYKSSN